MNDVTLLGSDISSEEAALFANAVASIPEKAKAKVKKPGGYSKKQKAKTLALPVAVDAPAAVETQKAPEVDLSHLLDDITVDVFGLKNAELDVMLEFRKEGFAKIAEAKAMNIYGLEAAAKSEKRRLSNITPKKAARAVFEGLEKQAFHPSDDGRKARITLAVMDELKMAFDKGDGDPFKKEAYISIVMKAMARVPEWQLEHEMNLAEAEKVWAEFSEKQLAHDLLLEEAGKLLDLANETAKVNGWPQTEARRTNGK